MPKCIICDKRPAANDRGWCSNCNAQIEAERKRRKPVEAVKLFHYRGSVVGLFPNGDGKLIARLLNMSLDRLPKSRTLNLDRYCEGYTREQIKRFKATVLRLASV